MEGCLGRECTGAGLHLLHFSVAHTAFCFFVCIGIFLALWFAWTWSIRLCRPTTRRAQVFSAAAIVLVASALFTSFQPPHPYWISELSVMLIVTSGLKFIDFLVWQDSQPQELSFWSLILDHALVLRPDAMQHKPGHRQPTGRSIGKRFMDSLWPLSRAFFQMCACEALNAILMQHEKADVFQAPYWYNCLISVTLASTLYLHLSYFFNSMKFVGVLFLDHDPNTEWPHLFKSPWLSTSPSEFWNYRWHQMFRHCFVRLAFQPTKRGLLWLLGIPSKQPEVSAPGTNSVLLLDHCDDRHQNTTPRTPGNSRYPLRHRKEQQPTTPRTPRSRSKNRRSPSATRSRSKSKRSPSVTATVEVQDMSGLGVRPSPRGQEHEALQKQELHGHGPQQQAHADAASTTDMKAQPKACSALASAALQILPSFSVFLFSGLLHEFLLLIFFGAPTGHQLAFFMVHAAALLVQRVYQKASRRPGRSTSDSASPPLTIWTLRRIICMLAWNIFLATTTPLFMRPWFLYSYHKELRVLVPGPIHYFVKRCMHK